MPKEFKPLALNDAGTHLTFSFAESPEIIFKVTNLTTINQFLLPVLQPNFKAPPTERVVVDLEYQVLDGEQNLLFSDIFTWHHNPAKGIFSTKKQQSIFLPYIFNLRESSFYLAVKINNPLVVAKNVADFQIKVETNNEQFFYFFLGLKICLFLLSMLTFARFLRRYLLQIRQTRAVEQKLVLGVSVLLVAYNFPFNFYLNYVSPSLVLLLLSSLVNILFYSYVCYLWMVTFEVSSPDHLERPQRLPQLRSAVEEGAGGSHGGRRLRDLLMGGPRLRQRPLQRVAGGQPALPQVLQEPLRLPVSGHDHLPGLLSRPNRLQLQRHFLPPKDLLPIFPLLHLHHQPVCAHQSSSAETPSSFSKTASAPTWSSPSATSTCLCSSISTCSAPRASAVSLADLQKYVRVDQPKIPFEEKDLNAVSIREPRNYSDESLEVEQI